jgi:hypothetical protein
MIVETLPLVLNLPYMFLIHDTATGSMPMTVHSPITSAEPFLLRFATPRSADAEMPGRYSSELGVWVVDGEDGAVPIIEVAGGGLVVTQSKTMTQVEVDDDDPSRFGVLETSTGTRVRQEVDDEDASLCLPELQTKTEVQQERDDEAVAPYW